MNKMHLLFFLMIFLLLAGACTEVDLYDDPNYTQRTEVKFSYDWVTNAPNDQFDHQRPDSMLVIAKRIVGAWKCAMVVNSDDGKGFYLWNAPNREVPDPVFDDDEEEPTPVDGGDVDVEPETSTDSVALAHRWRFGTTRAEGDSTSVADNDSTATEEPTGTDPEPEPTPTPDPEPVVDPQSGVDIATDLFEIIPGFYKFITFNLDTTEFIYQDINAYLMAEENKSTLQELCVEYKRYDYHDPHLRGTVNFWKDYNLYGDGKNYIQPDITPIYYDSIANERIVRNTQPTFTFKPGPLTQNIDIRFKIKKKVDVVPFIIDSVYADISGIPYRVNLANDFIDIKQTCKMMFQNHLEDASGNRITDTGTNTELRCHGNIDVLSLVNAHDSATIKGPGIMQVMIFVRGFHPVRGKINLYHCIRRANLMDDMGDGLWARKRKNHGVLEIDSDMLIDERLILTDDGDGGLDRWIPMGDEDIVIDT